MSSELLGTYSVPDGYFGARSIIYAVFSDGYIIHAHPLGMHRSAILPQRFEHAGEALWAINNSPNGKKYYAVILYGRTR